MPAEAWLLLLCRREEESCSGPPEWLLRASSWRVGICARRFRMGYSEQPNGNDLIQSEYEMDRKRSRKRKTWPVCLPDHLLSSKPPLASSMSLLCLSTGAYPRKFPVQWKFWWSYVVVQTGRLIDNLNNDWNSFLVFKGCFEQHKLMSAEVLMQIKTPFHRFLPVVVKQYRFKLSANHRPTMLFLSHLTSGIGSPSKSIFTFTLSFSCPSTLSGSLPKNLGALASANSSQWF